MTGLGGQVGVQPGHLYKDFLQSLAVVFHFLLVNIVFGGIIGKLFCHSLVAFRGFLVEKV